MKEDVIKIVFQRNLSIATYFSDKRIVEMTTRHGVEIDCKVPDDWATTRVCQFMETLLRANDNIV